MFNTEPRVESKRYQWLVGLLCVLGMTFAATNGVLYADRAAIPVVISDAWYFVDSYVSKDVGGALTWHDLFVKRSSEDHSQPLNKLLLSANVRLFGLDFWAESIFAALVAALVALLYLSISVYRLDWGRTTLVAGLAMSLIPISIMSLNSTSSYTWSLVGLFFLSIPPLVLVFLAISMKSSASSIALAFIGALALLLMQDNAALLGLASALAVMLMRSLRLREWHTQKWNAAAVLLALLLFRVVATMAGYSDLPASTKSPHGSLLNELPNFWRWGQIPASTSVAHFDHFRAVFGDFAGTVSCVVSVAVLGVHALFWFSAVRTIRRIDTTVAVGTMLFAYALTAGVVLARVPDFGSNYLHQHRYVVFYQLANTALLLQLIASQRSGWEDAVRTASGANPLAPVILALTLLGFAVVQGGLALAAWQNVIFVRNYSESMAKTIFCLARHPEVEAPKCQPLLTACGYNASIRNRIVGILRDNQLNVFSPAFQARHRIRPPEHADECVPPAASVGPHG